MGVGVGAGVGAQHQQITNYDNIDDMYVSKGFVFASYLFVEGSLLVSFSVNEIRVI